MISSISTKQLYNKTYTTFDFDGVWDRVLGTQQEKNGVWLIYGSEKNGKTWFALQLADMLKDKGKVLYVSAEQGLGLDFQDTVRRAGINAHAGGIKYADYWCFDDLKNSLKKSHFNIIIVDNLTVYDTELSPNDLFSLKNEFASKLFIFVAHEERGEPYTASAKEAKRYAKIICHIQGLTAVVSGRCPGGDIPITHETNLYH